MKLFVFIVCMFLIYAKAFAEAIEINYKTVAVVLAQDPKNINIPSIELYRNVKKKIQASDNWVVAPNWSVQLNLKNQDKSSTLNDLGAISAFDRRELVKAHPAANIIVDENQKYIAKSEVIKTMQIMLDTLALEGAIIVDCKPDGSQVVRSCGIYYYDRAKGKIVASTRKYFRAGVTEATNWADHLLLAMDKGLKNIKEQRKKEHLDKVLTFTERDNSPSHLTMEMQLSAIDVNDTSFDKEIPQASLNIYSENNNISWGVGLLFANAKQQENELKDLGLQLTFIPKAYGAKSLIWELPLGIAVHQRTLVKATEELELLDGKLFAGPSLLWKVNKSSSIGFAATYEKFINIEEKKTNPLTDLELFEKGLKYSFRFKHSF